MVSDLEAQKQSIRDETDRLNYELKVELPKRIAEARAFGDLKENAEYESARDRQGFVKARIGQLQAQMAQLSGLDISSISVDSIAYGSVVTVVNLDGGGNTTFTFVSSGEVNPAEGKISLSSPIGMALQNKTAGDTVEAVIPAGKRRFYIEKLVTIHGGVFEKKYSG